jgi:hypothetical protein
MMTHIEKARQFRAPGATISRVPDGTPRPASGLRHAVLIVTLLAAAARSARLAEAVNAQIPRAPANLQPQPTSRQRDAILIALVVLTAGAKLAPMALFAVTLATVRGLVRDSQIIPRGLTWYFGPAPAWYIRRQNRRRLRRQMLNPAAQLGTSITAPQHPIRARRGYPPRVPGPPGRPHRRTARWYERHGQLTDAVRHAAETGDWPLTASIVIDHLAIGEIIQPRRSPSLTNELGACRTATPGPNLRRTAETVERGHQLGLL